MEYRKKTIEEIRQMSPEQIDAETMMNLTGYKGWAYTPLVARELVSLSEEIPEGHCKDTLLWAFDYATTVWEFDREVFDILAEEWMEE